MAPVVVDLLCNFLMEPYPLLIKLTESSSGTEKKQHETNDGLFRDSVIKRHFGFTSLRTAAIDALCRALKATNRDNDSIVQICLTKLSSKLYMAGQDEMR